MVVLFVIATVLTFIIIDYFVQHRQAQLAPAGIATPAAQKPMFASVEDFFLPAGLFSSNSHVWGELSHHGTLQVGIDPFLLNALGAIDRVNLPQPGETIKKGDVLFHLHVGDQSVHVRAPFSGIVEKTNKAIEKNQKTNVRNLWAVRIKPDNISDTIKAFRVGHEAKEWMKEEIAKFREFLTSFTADPQLAFTMQDGGIPVTGSLATLDDDAWKKFETEFLAVEK